MPYLPVDLDGKKRWPAVAQGLGVPTGSVAWGFCEMWELCWTSKKDFVCLLQLECLFCAPGERVGKILEAFGFLESLPDGTYRVRGAARWLGLRAALSEGGKKSKGNLIQFKKATGIAGTPAGGEPGPSRPNTPALTPNTQHPTPKLQKENIEKEKVSDGEKFKSGLTLWCWYQQQREEAGYVREKPLHDREISAFLSEFIGEVNGDGERAEATIVAFARSKYWRGRAFLFTDFMRHWREFVPRKVITK